MGLIAITPNVLKTLRADFRSGVWSPVTEQFFQQLFDRVGGSSSVSITEVFNITQTLSDDSALAPVHAVQGVCPGLADLAPVWVVDEGRGALAPAPVDVGSVGDLGPRTEPVAADFTLGGP